MTFTPLNIYGIEIGPIGKTDAVCPHCETILPKFPGRKTACRACREFMFVRIRPLDRQRVLVTDLEAEKVEAMWSALRAWQYFLDGIADLEAAAMLLGELSSLPLSYRAESWSRLAEALIERMNVAISSRSWGALRHVLTLLVRFNLATSDLSRARGYALLLLALDYAGCMGQRRAGFWPETLTLAASSLRAPDWLLILGEAREASAIVREWGGDANPTAIVSALKACINDHRARSV